MNDLKHMNKSFSFPEDLKKLNFNILDSTSEILKKFQVRKITTQRLSLVNFDILKHFEMQSNNISNNLSESMQAINNITNNLSESIKAINNIPNNLSESIKAINNIPNNLSESMQAINYIPNIFSESMQAINNITNNLSESMQAINKKRS